MPGDDSIKPEGEVTTPTGEEGQTPEQTETLITKEEHEAAVAKATSDAKADMGRLAKGLRDAEAALARMQQQEKEHQEAEYRRQEAEARDDPDELSRIRRRREDVERAAKLAEREAKVQTQLTRILQTTAKAFEGQYNVSVETLLKYAGDDADAMEELAKSYGERKPSGEKVTPKRVTEPPDEGKTKGGGKGLTKADVEKMSPQERHERSAEIAAIPF